MQVTVLREVQRLLECCVEPGWKGWEDESTGFVERAGLAWAAAEG